MKKERFIRCYSQARDESLLERVIQAGWRATGLCPFNPALVLQLLQVIHRPVTPPLRTQSLSPSNITLKTPQGHQDIHQAQQLLQQSQSLSRSVRHVLSKNAKALSIVNVRAAELQAENTRLKHLLEQAQPSQPRKRVKIDQN